MHIQGELCKGLICYSYVFRVEEHTRALKLVGTREHFNEHVHVSITAVYNVLHISNNN